MSQRLARALDIRHGLLEAADGIASIREQFASPKPAAPHDSLGRRVRRALERAVGPEAVQKLDEFAINDPDDVAWAWQHPTLDRVTHVFHSHSLGTRAAAAYLPGQKVAIFAEGRLAHDSVQAILTHLAKRRPRAIVFHGWSDNALMLAQVLRETFGSQLRLLAVWHGNTAEFTSSLEFAQVGRLVALKRKGVLDMLGSVKPDMHLVDGAFSKQWLLNVGPRIASRVERSEPPSSALVPLPNDWRKNYFTNVFAAAAARLKVVYLTSPLPKPMPVKVRAKVRVLPSVERAALFALMPRIGLVMNATLSDCQPMSALESVAFGVPCLTGRLSLGELDRHPYQQLAQITEVDTIGPVARAAANLFEMQRLHRTELGDMMADYETELLRRAFEGWEAFVR